MDIQFVYGKIKLEKLQNIDAVVCPTDTHCSGSGGLDQAIHQAAGPNLRACLEGKHLSDGEVLITDGFDLGVRYIVHAAIPIATVSDVQAESLRGLYAKILSSIDGLHTKTPCKTAVITLLGTGSRGWSYDQSMAALWSVIMEYHCQHGSVYFEKGSLETLFIYYPSDAVKIVSSYQYRTSQAFFHAPDQWGLRGDPYLWYALAEHFDDPKFNRISRSDFIQEIQRFFHGKTNRWLCGDTEVYVKEWAHGGMSSGGISSFMAQIGIPILCSNLCKLNLSSALGTPSFIVPVTLRSVDLEEYQLFLPYEILPELTTLRKREMEIIQKKRICLDAAQPYRLTISHFENAPDLIDHYSLDVEKASDSHYVFSEAAAEQICKELGYPADAIATAFSVYLKEHGGSALETLVKKFATKEFHYY